LLVVQLRVGPAGGLHFFIKPLGDVIQLEGKILDSLALLLLLDEAGVGRIIIAGTLLVYAFLLVVIEERLD
jgi:hypothetical protein